MFEWAEPRLHLQSMGYAPVPLIGKASFLPGWPYRCPDADRDEMRRWEMNFRYTGKDGKTKLYRGNDHNNTGILCDGVVAVDIDVMNPDVAGRLTALAEGRLGTTPLHRVGRAPKVALLYRTDVPVRGTKTCPMRIPDGSEAQVEILGAGQQLAAFGRHPSTGKNYRWPRSSPMKVPRAELPAATAEELVAFRDAATALLLEVGAKPLEPARLASQETADGPARPPPDNFFGRVNHLALAHLVAWIPELFPTARCEGGTGAWRVSSADLGRNLEEDLSIHPVHGGRDFGTEESCSPIDVVMEHGGAPDPASAALWLCDRMGLEPAALGWRSGAIKVPEAELREMMGAEPSALEGRSDGALEALMPGSPKLRLLSPAECAASEPRGYVVKGLIAPGDLVIVFGSPGAGKSVVCPHIAYAVARGAPVFGRRTRVGPVLYVACEDPHGMRQRVTALRLTHGDAPGFFLVEGVSDLLGMGNGDAGALRSEVERVRPALVVIDTMAAAFPGLRENESEDMSRAVALARSLTEWGAAVVLVHHAPKGDDSTPRGHGVLNGAADVTMRLAVDAQTRVVTGRLGKNRNGPVDFSAAFTIEAPSIGIDEDGDAITAPVAAEVAGKAALRPGKLPKAQAVVLDVLRELLASRGRREADGRTTVFEEDWRRECDDTRRPSMADNPDSRKRAFRRAVEGLLAPGRVCARDGLVWLADAARDAANVEVIVSGFEVLPDQCCGEGPGSGAGA